MSARCPGFAAPHRSSGSVGLPISFLANGLVPGFSVAAPVSAIGALLIRRAIARRRVAGLVLGLGAATADVVRGSFASFGLWYVASVPI
jgi:hypothetical protein